MASVAMLICQRNDLMERLERRYSKRITNLLSMKMEILLEIQRRYDELIEMVRSAAKETNVQRRDRHCAPLIQRASTPTTLQPKSEHSTDNDEPNVPYTRTASTLSIAEIPKFQCTQCSFSTNYRRYLERHSRAHSVDIRSTSSNSALQTQRNTAQTIAAKTRITNSGR